MSGFIRLLIQIPSQPSSLKVPLFLSLPYMPASSSTSRFSNVSPTRRTPSKPVVRADSNVLLLQATHLILLRLSLPRCIVFFTTHSAVDVLQLACFRRVPSSTPPCSASTCFECGPSLSPAFSKASTESSVPVC